MSGSGGASLQMLGASIGSFLNARNNKKIAPTAIDYVPVDLQKEQERAIKGNLVAEGDIETLLARANTFTQSQASGLMEQAVPGWGKLSQKFLQTADALVTNPYDVPKDVEQNLARIAAERGISSGARGQFSDFSLLRDLGVNALQYGSSRISQGQSLLQLIGSLSPRVSPLSPLAFYITPQQQAANQQFTNTTNQAIKQGAENARVGAVNWNTQNKWDSIAAGLTYAGGSADEGWGQMKGFISPMMGGAG